MPVSCSLVRPGASTLLSQTIFVLCGVVLAGNVSALASGQQQLPYAAVRGQTSAMTPPQQAAKIAGPRDHA